MDRTTRQPWLVFLLGALALASCATTPDIVELTPAQDQMVRPAELACQSHDDCIKIDAIDGCGCSAGSFDGVANKQYQEAIQKRIQAAHPATHCPTVMNGDPACIGVIPYCHQGKCRLVHQD